MKFDKQTEKILHTVMNKTILLVLTLIFLVAAAVTFRIHPIIGTVMLVFFILFFKLLINQRELEKKLEKKLGP